MALNCCTQQISALRQLFAEALIDGVPSFSATSRTTEQRIGMMPEYAGIEDCNTIIEAEGVASLLAYSPDSGPYLILIDNIPVGSFGLNLTDDSSVKPSDTQQLLDAHAYDVALMAFDLIRHKLDQSNDPAKLREMARAACRHARLRFLTTHRMNAAVGRKGTRGR